MISDLRDVLSNDAAPKESTTSREKEKRSPSRTCMYVMYCLQPAVRSAISIFNLDTDTNLSETIFRGICKGKSIHWMIFDLLLTLTSAARQKILNRKEIEQKEIDRRNQSGQSSSTADRDRKRIAASQRQINKQRQRAERVKLLELAMNWNCIDVARELILKNSLDNILVRRLYFDCQFHRLFFFRIKKRPLSSLWQKSYPHSSTSFSSWEFDRLTFSSLLMGETDTQVSSGDFIPKTSG